MKKPFLASLSTEPSRVMRNNILELFFIFFWRFNQNSWLIKEIEFFTWKKKSFPYQTGWDLGIIRENSVFYKQTDPGKTMKSSQLHLKDRQVKWLILQRAGHRPSIWRRKLLSLKILFSGNHLKHIKTTEYRILYDQCTRQVRYSCYFLNF